MDVPMMGEVAFDSTKPDDPDVNPMIAPTLKSMTEKAGKTYPITVSAQGEVTSGDTKAVGRHPVFLFPLPKGPVDVGGAWEAVRERSMGQRKAFARGKCTLARSEGGVAELSFAGNLEEEAAKKDEAKKDAEKKDEAKKEAAAEEGGDDPSKSISAPKGTLKTAMKLDVATGMAVESTDETDLKITMPNPQTGESLDITVKAKSKLERRKPEAPKAGEEKK
jgi:hypothetical protein